jgi:hypothetical protein
MDMVLYCEIAKLQFEIEKLRNEVVSIKHQTNRIGATVEFDKAYRNAQKPVVMLDEMKHDLAEILGLCGRYMVDGLGDTMRTKQKQFEDIIDKITKLKESL